MASITGISSKNPSSINQFITILIGGTLLFLVLMTSITGVYQLMYKGRILPGISVAGVDISGLLPAEASIKLMQNMTFPATGKILFKDNGKIWVASPAELGMIFNIGGTVQEAFQMGRSGGMIKGFTNQIRSLQRGLNISPQIILDERVTYAYLQNIAREVDKPVIEADLSLNGVDVIAHNGQTGRLLDVDSTMRKLIPQLYSFSDGEIQLDINEIKPSILEVNNQANNLKNILSSALVLSLPDSIIGDPGPWIIQPEKMASMLVLKKVIDVTGAEFSIEFDQSALNNLMDEIGSEVQKKPQNARFIFNDETRQIDLFQSAVLGRSLNIESTIQTINSLALAGEHSISVSLNTESPLVADNATAQSLGITELVSMQSTYFYGSSPERIQNIKTASSQFKGLLIAPGETFSMGNALGDVSLENGYAEALIIYDNRTIKGVGGGVCQVSTTLFRTVFFGGYPIIERHPHAYRVAYYEQTSSGAHDSSLAGLDATVYVPLVDFKFTNDSPYWLLMETYVYNNNQLTWKFYSTSEGRTISWNSSGLQNIIPAPDALFEQNPDLGLYELKQIDWAADGARITINRTVYKNGQVYFVDNPLVTVYSPWQAICQYGIGVTDPKAKAVSENKCQAP